MFLKMIHLHVLYMKLQIPPLVLFLVLQPSFIICRVNYVCSEGTDFLGRRFRHNILYHLLIGELGVTINSKKELSFINCEALLIRLGLLGGFYEYFFTLACTSFTR